MPRSAEISLSKVLLNGFVITVGPGESPIGHEQNPMVDLCMDLDKLPKQALQVSRLHAAKSHPIDPLCAAKIVLQAVGENPKAVGENPK